MTPLIRLTDMLKPISERLMIMVLAGFLVGGHGRALADNPDVYPNTPGPQAAVPSSDASQPTADAGADAAKALTPDQLDSLVAPIALYPDTLVSQILVAATYPLEIIQAEQWLEQNPTLKGPDLTKAAQAQNWDASIQALVVFPDVIKRLSQDVTWTTNVGNAFLARQSDVMDAVQRMRFKAEDAGKLKSTPQEKVTTTTQEGQKVVEIEPANPAVVYVPYYDPTLIWGPSYYYSYPAWDYPPRPYGAWFWFGSGISLSYCYGPGWNVGWGWGWHPSWHDHVVVVNNRFISHYNYHAVAVSHVGNVAVWHHDAAHRLGVAYPNRAVARQYHPGFYAARSRPNVAQAQAQFHTSAQHFSAAHSAPAQHFGNRDIPASNRNYSAFGGVGQGARAHVYSQRGNTSLSHTSAHVMGASHTVSGGHVPSGGGHAGGGHFSGGGSAGGGHESGHGNR